VELKPAFANVEVILRQKLLWWTHPQKRSREETSG